MKTVFITIFDIFQLKNFFYTDFYSEIKDKVKIVIICPYRNVKYIKNVFKDNPNLFVEGVDINLHLNKLQFLLLKAEQAAQKNRSINSFFLQRARVKGKWKKYLYYKFFYTFFSNRLGHKILKFLENILFLPGEFQYLFDKYHPDLVFSTNLISTIDFRLLKDAKKNKVKSISNIKGWDMPNMKGYLTMNADKLVAQTDIQKREMIKYHQVPEKKIVVLGNPGFDIYFNDEGLMTRGEFCKFAGLDPNKKIIFMNISAVFINPFPEDPILNVDRWISEGRIKKPAQILISPRSKYGFSEELLNNTPNIVIHIAGEMIGGGARSNLKFEKNEIYDLKNCLYHADVVITTGSTLGMEATLMNTPSISIAFDFRPVNYWLSAKVRSFDEYFEPAKMSGGVFMAYSAEDLIKGVNEYLENPEKDREGRARIVREQTQFRDDQSGKRVAKFLLSELGI